MMKKYLLLTLLMLAIPFTALAMERKRKLTKQPLTDQQSETETNLQELSAATVPEVLLPRIPKLKLQRLLQTQQMEKTIKDAEQAKLSFLQNALKGEVSQLAKLHLLVSTIAGTSLQGALLCGHKNAIETLLANGVSIEYQDTNGNTPLLIAVCAGKYELAEFLLTKNANVNAQNKLGQTGLILATQKAIADNTFTALMTLLYQKYGANPALKDAKDKTFLDYCKPGDPYMPIWVGTVREKLQSIVPA